MLTLGLIAIILGGLCYVLPGVYTGRWHPVPDDNLPLKPGFTLMSLGVVLIFFHFHHILGFMLLIGFVFVAYHVWVPDKKYW